MHKLLQRGLLAFLALFLLGTPIYSQWIPGDDHKMHFPQLPDEEGWNVNATKPMILADDWECSETGLIKDLHFWGSWLHNDIGQIVYFQISFHEDIPDPNPEDPTTYSRPGETIWDGAIYEFTTTMFETDLYEGWYDPITEEQLFNDHMTYFQYDIYLPEDAWFLQEEGKIYWVNISAEVANPAATKWGWKSSQNHFMDDAVWAQWGDLTWMHMFQPLVYMYIPGDVDHDGDVDNNDVTYLTNWLMGPGPPPPYSVGGFYPAADVNGDGVVDMQDATYLAAFVSGGGPPPVYNPNFPPYTSEEAISLDLAFVITGEPVEEDGACCYVPAGSFYEVCIVTTQTDCLQNLGGTFMGPGTVCTADEACCMTNGTCVMADPLCCINMGGTPQGIGTSCSAATEACCMNDGTCIDVDPLCCDDLGGTPQGPGTTCSAATIACCLTDGSCIDVDPLCCDDLGGYVSPFSAVCLGDNNQNGTDDACEEEILGACCYIDPTNGDIKCVVTTQNDCETNLGGVYMGDYTVCTDEEACCLQDGSCIMAEPQCCVEFGGTPQGAGTVCTQEEACCIDDPTGIGMICIMVDPLCCDEMGGVPQGQGTVCTNTIACCLQDGSCVDVDPLCCDDLGGIPSPYGAAACLGDNDQNGTDDACEPSGDEGACCYPEPGTFLELCTVTTQAGCDALGGTFLGIGTICLGDSDGDGSDDACKTPWQEGDPHKMHHPQLPDEAGWDVLATFPYMLADDWRCTGTGPVKDLHFWGSWYHGVVGEIISFRIEIWSDRPDPEPGDPFTYSMPNQLMWVREISNFNPMAIDPVTAEGWFEPEQHYWLWEDHMQYFQYDIYLSEQDWFYQEEGTIYWLVISAVLEDPENTKWGWKSTLDHFNDDAVWAQFDTYNWFHILQPPYYSYVPGDVNGDGYVDLSDVTQLTSFVNTGSPAPAFYVPFPPFYPAADVNGDCVVDQADVDYLLSSIYGGPAPIFCPEAPVYPQGASLDLAFVITDGEDPCAGQYPGDVNDDGVIDTNDPVYLFNYLYSAGPVPPVLANADVNGDCCIDHKDFDELTSYVATGLPVPVSCTCVNPLFCNCRPGDANGDININIADASYIVNAIFFGGGAPWCDRAGDANCDGGMNIADASYIINKIFFGGADFCTCCEWEVLHGKKK